MAKDIVSALEKDHREVEKLFARYERARGRANTARGRAAVADAFDEIRRELSVHAAAEEMVLYPEVRTVIPEKGESLANEGLAEHGRVKRTLATLEGLGRGEPEFDRRMQELVREVRHHVEEEEKDLLAELRRRLPHARLVDLGGALERAKSVAPTHPHPGAPDRPPANVIVGLAAGMLDRARDAVGSLLGGAEEKAPPATGRAKAKRAATGSRAKKATARGRKPKSSGTKTAAKKASRRRPTSARKSPRTKAASSARGKGATAPRRAARKK